MSVKILGNNSFEGVPLLAADSGMALELARRCDPFFRDVALAGLSALCHGLRQSPEVDRLDTLRLDDLFDESGMFTATDLARRVGVGVYSGPEYADHFAAGIHIATAAFIGARLFGRQFPVVNSDYLGPTGHKYVRRRMVMPLPINTQANLVWGEHVIGNIQASVFGQEAPEPQYKHRELAFAATHLNVGELPWSTTTSLGVSINEEECTVSAQVTSATREGDFARVSQHAGFSELSSYTDLVHANL